LAGLVGLGDRGLSGGLVIGMLEKKIEIETLIATEFQYTTQSKFNY